MTIRLMKDKFILLPFVASIVLMLISIFIVAANFAYISGGLIVNYGTEGFPILGDLATLQTIIAIASGIILINLFLIYKIYSLERFFAHALSLTNLFISILTLLGLSGIVSLN